MLSAFLDRLKGSHMEVSIGDATQAGVIPGARSIVTGSGDKRDVAVEQITLLLDSGAISNFDLCGRSFVAFA